jgi:subtilisin
MTTNIKLLPVLLAGALLTPAARALDFDQGIADAGAIVSQARDAASRPELPETKGIAVAEAETPEGAIERSIVVFKDGVSAARRGEVVRAAGGTVTRDLWLIDAVAVITPRVKTAGFKRSLNSFAEVKRVERDEMRNWLYGTAALPTTAPAPGLKTPAVKGCPDWWPPGYPCPWPDDPDDGNGGQRLPWGVKRVNAQASWEVTRGKGVKLVVIDTGVDGGHSELNVLGGFSAFEGQDWNDGHGHGTHVAGTVAATDNDKGVVGVAPDVDLYAAKVLDAQGRGSYESVIAGIQWAVENDMDVANMSLGGDSTTEALGDAVKAAKAAGLVIVAAAGNNGGKVGYPAAYPETIAIAASDSGDRGARFSSRGPEVDLIAPGVQIDSTWKGGGYRKLDGTSMASPHAAGLAALAIASKGLTGVDAVRDAMIAAATKLSGVAGPNQGHGMVDASKLVR